MATKINKPLDNNKLNQIDNQIITFGCRLNNSESEAIKKNLYDSTIKNHIIFNSCAVTENAEKDLVKSIKKARRLNPDATIVVTGCAAQINPQKYAVMNEVDLVIGNKEKTDPNFYQSIIKNKDLAINYTSKNTDKLDKITINKTNQHQDTIFLNNIRENNSKIAINNQQRAKIKVNDIMSVRDTAPQLVSYFESKTRAFLEIQNGCNHRCTFCIIPFGRGNSRSVPFGEIISQARKMIDAGHKEIVLTGVDITDYGSDIVASPKFSNILKRMLKLLPDLPRLRLSSVDVAELDDDFFELLANEPRLMPYLHLSLQSGDDLILKRMARRHNRQNIIDFCQNAKIARPEITFGADIIAGFPTENDEAFNNSCNLISELSLIFCHIFPYSARSGTAAAKMPQIDSKIIRERARILRDIGQLELQKFLKSNINNKFTILIEDGNIGKTDNFLNAKIINNTNNIKAGDLVEVLAIASDDKGLIVEVI